MYISREKLGDQARNEKTERVGSLSDIPQPSINNQRPRSVQKDRFS